MELTGAQERATALLRQVTGESDGGVCMAPAGRWHAGEDRVVPLAHGEVLRIAHDEREAPYVVGADGQESCSTLVSLSDEDVVAACAWVRPAAESVVAGIGIDLASASDFAGARGERFNRLIFSPREQELAPTLAQDAALGFAYAFSAKEAAFKACAAPLRRWYDEHDEELAFDITQFELCDVALVRGTLRGGRAQEAIERMGLTLRLARCELEGLACTFVVALQLGQNGPR